MGGCWQPRRLEPFWSCWAVTDNCPKFALPPSDIQNSLSWNWTNSWKTSGEFLLLLSLQPPNTQLGEPRGEPGRGTESSPTLLAGTLSLTHPALSARNGIYPLMNFATVRPHTLPQSSSQALEDPQKAQTPTPEPFDVETRKVRWLWRVSSSPALFEAQAGKRGLPAGLYSTLCTTSVCFPLE